MLLNFQTSYCNLQIRDLGAKAYLIFLPIILILKWTMTLGSSTNNFCHTYQILSKKPILLVCRCQKSSQLLVKTSSIYHLADSWCQNVGSKELIFVKWLSIILFNNSWQLPTVAMVKLSWLNCCVENYSHTKLRLFPNF